MSRRPSALNSIRSLASGALTGGVDSATGGFWPGATLLQTPEAPLLASELLPGGSVRIYWPLLLGSDYAPDETMASLSPPAIPWSQVPFPHQTNATHISVTVPPSAGRAFYRLRHP